MTQEEILVARMYVEDLKRESACNELNTISQIIDTRLAKKPILKSGQSVVHVNKGDKPHEMRVDKWQEWCCPVCGWFVGQRYNRPLGNPHDQRKSNYCNECGQYIDWSNE